MSVLPKLSDVAGSLARQASRAPSGAAAYTIGQLAAKALGLAQVLVIARALGPALFGQYTLALLLASVCGLLLEFGASNAALRLAALKDEVVLRQFLTVRCLTLWTCGGLFLVASIAAVIVAPHAVASLALAVVGSGMLLAANAIASSTLMGLGKGGRSSLPNAFFNLIALSAAVALSLGALPATAWWAFATFSLGASVAATTYWRLLRAEGLISRRIWSWQAYSSPDRQLSLRAGGVQSVQYVSNYADQYAAALALPIADLGAYSAAVRVNDIGANLPTIAVTAMQPSYVKASSTLTGATRYVTQVLYLFMGVGLLASALMVVLAPTAVLVLIGSEYEEAGEIARILGLGLFAFGTQALAMILVRGTAGARIGTTFTLSVYIARAAATVPAVLVAATVWGLRGLAYAHVLTGLVLYSFVLGAICQRLQIRLAKLLSPFTAASLVPVALVAFDQTAVAAALLVALSGLSFLLFWRRTSMTGGVEA